ncbi:AmpG family muropeptide MFS transporter [Phreatobacter stygius]|uniref:AmpG family muropeptide MFS transporter n=1 Tax=Phreatobacter stygius TaxID=1940610 RepID=A0A4D7B535_9HYPH|nr:MFS transporter [Phreatobacter stygius]QCI65558.1 AmpG family muropeptide MFS transporter [Phreatobacter stygius]
MTVSETVAKTSDTGPAPDKTSWREAAAVYFRRDVLVVLFLGFAAGLPLALSGSTLLVWMAESSVNLTTIGLFALVGTPYTIKFLWAPVVDALDIPWLSGWLGRRRGWLIFSQILLMVAIAFLGLQNPDVSPAMIAVGAVLVATAAATQDIVIDAYRVEKLDTSEQAAGMGSYVAAYRIGMLVSTAGALLIVSYFEKVQGFAKATSWSLGYCVMAGFVLVGMITTLVAREPARSAEAVARARAGGNPMARVAAAAVGAFSQFLTREMAFVVLAFVVLFKFCDAFVGAMTGPFVIRGMGYSREEYAAIVKGLGLAATLGGGFAGGFVARALDLKTSLWLAGFLQMASNLVFALQAQAGASYGMLAFVIVVENFTGAIGTVIFVAYLSSLCNSPLHTATQYALLSALAAVGRTYLSAPAGSIAEQTGWFWFFVLSCLTAIPSFLLLWWLQARGHFDALVRPSGPLSADD